MEYEKRRSISEEEYLEMIRLKTAVMLGACLESGAIVGGASESDRKNLYDFGIYLGIAFQIKDDLLDVYGNPATFGKKIGGDILCNKKTFLLVTALNSAQKEDKEALRYWLGNNMQTDDKINAVRNLYTKLAVKDKAHEALKVFYNRSLSALQKVSVEEKRKKILESIAHDLIER